jgi:hypothetical protein
MDGQTARRSRPVSNWRKTVRPSAADYKPFKDEAYWIRYNERFVSTIQSHGLEHLIDPDYVVKDAALDQLQRCWLYKILQDIMQAPLRSYRRPSFEGQGYSPYGRRFSLTTTTP